MYKVFEVNDCFEDWAMSDFLIGAESREDLISHLPEIMIERDGKRSGTKAAKRIIKDEYRIKEIENLFTDKPYTSLTSYGYIE